MPTISQQRAALQDAKNKGLIAPVNKAAQAPQAPPPPPANSGYPNTPNAPLRTPLPGFANMQPDQQRAFYNSATPQTRIPIRSGSGNPITGATAQTQALIQTGPLAGQIAANTAAIANLQNQSVFLGNWSSAITYQKSNQVLYSGGYYIATALNHNAEPDVSPAFWQLITNQNSSVYEGSWSSLTTYAEGETVSYQGSFWVSLTTNLNSAPSLSSTDWTNLGSTSVLTGAWASGFAYTQNMQVSYNGNIFVALQANTNHTPPTPPATNVYWQIIGPADLDFIADGTVYIRGIGTVASESIVIGNANFEASASLPVPGWTAAGPATLSYNTASPYSGNQSLVVATTAASSARTIQNWSCQPGDGFLFSCEAKSDGVGQPFGELVFYDKTGAFVNSVGGSTGTSTSYSTLSGNGTAGAGAVGFFVAVGNLSGSASSCTFDEVSAWRVISLDTQVVDGTSRFAATASTLTYRPTTNPLSATDAGGTATVNVAAFVLLTSSKGTVSYSSGSVTGLSYSTLYYIYFDDGTLAGGAPTYNATTTKTTAINGTGRFFIGSIVTPAATAPNTVGNNDGGVGAQAGQTSVFLFGASASAGVSGQGSVTGATNAIDGNLTTHATLQITAAGSAASGATLNLTTASPTSAPWSSLTLNILSAVPTNGVTPGANIAKLQYSLDGGNSFTSVYSLGASTTRALTTDSISLPLNQNLALVQIQASLQRNNGFPQAVELDLYEAWVLGLQ
jgi:hypothetical protein